MAFGDDGRGDKLFVGLGKNPHVWRMNRPAPGRRAWIARLGVACSLLLYWLMPGARGQAIVDGQQAQTSESAYRKFDERLASLRTRIAQTYAISSAKGIDEEQYVTIGGIQQWITIRGWDRDNPVLLFLHGGPGDVTNPWAFGVFAPWEKRFTVVQWDQRGAGRTLRKSGPGIAATITVERMVQDGIELTEYLLKHLGKKKIIVVGHSFGTILELGMVRARPELFMRMWARGKWPTKPGTTRWPMRS